MYILKSRGIEMNKILQIEVTTTVYFLGEDFPEEAEVTRAVRKELIDGNYDASGTSIKYGDKVSIDDLDRYPYGEGGDRHTIREWLEHG
jgi:hypothetical protein